MFDTLKKTHASTASASSVTNTPTIVAIQTDTNKCISTTKKSDKTSWKTKNRKKKLTSHDQWGPWVPDDSYATKHATPFCWKKNSLTLTTTTLDHITAGILHAHIETVANDTITTLKHEFDLAAITDAPSVVNDKSKSTLLKNTNKLVITNTLLRN